MRTSCSGSREWSRSAPRERTRAGPHVVRARHGSCRSAFTVLELMIVVTLIAVLAAIAIPSLASSRRAAEETRAIGTLRSIASSMGVFRTRRGFYANLDQLVTDGYVPPFEIDAGNLKRGEYHYVRLSPVNLPWACVANPISPGLRGFYVDASNVLRYTLDGSQASDSSPVLE